MKDGKRCLTSLISLERKWTFENLLWSNGRRFMGGILPETFADAVSK